MLKGAFTKVLDAGSRDEFREEIIRFTQDIGFDTVSAITVVEHGLGNTEFIAIDNTPEDYRNTYVDLRQGRGDPVMQHLKRQSVPIIWNQDTYVNLGMGELWEHNASFGYCNGIAMALHLPDGKHFLFGVDREEALPDEPDTLQRLVADLQLFAVHAQDSAVRLLLPSALQPERPALTPRELETLRWTMEGKTAWEVGALLGISERTVVFHANNAMHKLGCATKHEAVLKALRLGLIN